MNFSGENDESRIYQFYNDVCLKSIENPNKNIKENGNDLGYFGDIFTILKRLSCTLTVDNFVTLIKINLDDIIMLL